MSQVRSYTRTLPSGRTVTVRQHSRDDDGLTEQQQDKRDRFQRRVEGERNRGPRSTRVPGEKRRRKPGGKQMRKASRHVKKARRLWRRHKVKALAYGALAGAEALSGLTRKAAAGTRKAWKQRKRRRK